MGMAALVTKAETLVVGNGCMRCKGEYCQEYLTDLKNYEVFLFSSLSILPSLFPVTFLSTSFLH